MYSACPFGCLEGSVGIPSHPLVRQFLMLTRWFHDQFVVRFFEYALLHFFKKELLHIVYRPMQKPTPMKYGNHFDPH